MRQIRIFWFLLLAWIQTLDSKLDIKSLLCSASMEFLTKQSRRFLFVPGLCRGKKYYILQYYMASFHQNLLCLLLRHHKYHNLELWLYELVILLYYSNLFQYSDLRFLREQYHIYISSYHHELILYVDVSCLFENCYSHKFHIRMDSLLHGLPKYDALTHLYQSSYSYKSHIWTYFFLHGLMKVVDSTHLF